MKLSIKRASLDELDMLMEWRMRVLAEVFSDSEQPDWEAIRKNNEDYYKETLSDGTHTACFAVNEDDGKIIGCGGICYQKEMPSPDNLTGTNGYLMNIYTLPEYRGHGVGRRMVEFLIDDAKKRGTEKIYLESAKDAKHLYEEIGFSDMQDYMKI
ncbi:GNAT family N-acetyltransferase [Selenomonas montiformis]|uniref:GNAT family N-acetyltransferase n=1 Tax=Selenomonas montiformis TaxID=2652285 RepID=UPI003F8AC1CD